MKTSRRDVIPSLFQHFELSSLLLSCSALTEHLPTTPGGLLERPLVWMGPRRGGGRAVIAGGSLEEVRPTRQPPTTKLAICFHSKRPGQKVVWLAGSRDRIKITKARTATQ